MAPPIEQYANISNNQYARLGARNARATEGVRPQFV